MGTRKRIAAILLGATAVVGGGSLEAQAMQQPPQCVRNCSPVEVDTTGPCYGVTVVGKSVDNLCYLGPPPPPPID